MSEARSGIDKARSVVEGLKSKAKDGTVTDADLVEIRVKLDDIGSQMRELVASLEPLLDENRKREAELGPKPADGQPPEPQSLADERQALTQAKTEINTDLGKAMAIAVEADQLAEAVTEMRRRIFTETLLGRSTISKASMNEAYGALQVELQELRQKISTWFDFTWQHKRTHFLLAIALSVVLALLFVFIEYRLFSHYLHHERDEQKPTSFRRHSYAFWSTLLPTLGLIAFCGLVPVFLNGFNVLQGDLFEMLVALLISIVTTFFIIRISDAVLAPYNPAWRIFDVTDRGARVLWWLIILMVLVNVGDYLTSTVSEILGSPPILSVAKSLVAAVVVGFILLIAALIKPLRPKEDAGAIATGAVWPASIRFLLLLLGAFLIVAPLLGYVGLGQFVARQIVIFGSLIVAMYLGFSAASSVSEPEVFKASPVGRVFLERFRFGEIAVEQIGLVFGILLYLFVLAVGLPIIFILWGYQLRDIENFVETYLAEITIGSVTISVSGVLIGIVVFVIGYFAVRRFQRWFDEKVMMRSRLDVGLRNSIRTAVGYVGMALAALIGLSIAGLNLSNLALIAGALSLGIGFGLQNIVNNFVSGLILLAERPFKVGDWIVTGSNQGFVKHISVRATEIETFQRQSIIIPNSELINAAVGNWTHGNILGRTEIPIGISYDSDPRAVIAILEEIGATNEMVLKDPAPMVVFSGFGDSSLDFELRVYLKDVLYGISVATDLRLKIFERFKQEGIEIPFPQRDVHVSVSGTKNGDSATKQAVDADGVIVTRQTDLIRGEPQGGD